MTDPDPPFPCECRVSRPDVFPPSWRRCTGRHSSPRDGFHRPRGSMTPAAERGLGFTFTHRLQTARAPVLACLWI